MDLILFFLIFNLLLFFLSNKIILLFNIYDFPDKKRKIHKSKTSLSGGLFIYLNYVAIFILYFLSEELKTNLNFFFGSLENFFLFFVTCSIFFLMGYLDDKLNLNANLKLLFFSIIIILILLLDSSLLINLINFSFSENIMSLGRFNFFFTIMCFLLFINAFNMFDGINLQTGLYSIYLFIVFLLITNNLQLFLPIIFSLFLFLYLNFKNKVFLGNSGSLFFSFSIAYFIIRIFNNNFTLYSDEIFLLMILPGLDMLRLFIIRLINKKNPFKPDKQHLHHFLLSKFKFKNTIFINTFFSISPFMLSLIVESYFVIILFLIIYLNMIFYLQKHH